MIFTVTQRSNTGTFLKILDSSRQTCIQQQSWYLPSILTPKSPSQPRRQRILTSETDSLCLPIQPATATIVPVRHPGGAAHSTTQDFHRSLSISQQLPFHKPSRMKTPFRPHQMNRKLRQEPASIYSSSSNLQELQRHL